MRHERPHGRAAKSHYELSPSDMDCHGTLPRGHATGRTISHLDVLRVGFQTGICQLGVILYRFSRPCLPVHVCFAPKATEVLHGRKITLCAYSRHSPSRGPYWTKPTGPG